MSSETTIMDLDDYSLSHLFSFLTVEEMARVGYTCLRFKQIIGLLIGRRRVHHEKNIGSDFEKFYTSYGEFIRCIDIYYYPPCTMMASWRKFEAGVDRFHYLVPKYCHNIEVAIITNKPIEFLNDMLASNKNIKYLKFVNGTRDWEDNTCNSLSDLKNLIYLDLSGNTFLDGGQLSKLTSLKELNLEGCYSLDSKGFIEICRANKLSILNVIECYSLNTEAFRILVETQTELKYIKVDHWYRDGDVSQVVLLENLHQICIRYGEDSEEPSSLLRKLSEHNPSSIIRLVIQCDDGEEVPSDDLERILIFSNLEILAVHESHYLDDPLLAQISKACKLLQRIGITVCDQITNEGILHLVRNLKYLSVLNLQHCEQLDEGLIPDMSEAKRTLDNKIKLKVVVHMELFDNIIRSPELVQVYCYSSDCRSYGSCCFLFLRETS